MVRAPVLVFKLLVLTTLLHCTWSARVNRRNMQKLQKVAKLANIGEQAADTNTSKIETRGGPLRWFLKRMEQILGTDPGTFTRVNENRLNEVKELLVGRWFGVQGTLNRQEDFFVIDISARGEGKQQNLFVQTNQGLEGTIPWVLLTTAFKRYDKILRVSDEHGADNMFMMQNVADFNYNSFFFAPNKEEVENLNDVMWIYKVSDWLGRVRKPANHRKWGSPPATKEILTTLHDIAHALDGIDLPSGADAQAIIGEAYRMPDWLRNAYDDEGRYAGSGGLQGPYQPPSKDATPKRSAMKVTTQAQQEERHIPGKKVEKGRKRVQWWT